MRDYSIRDCRSPPAGLESSLDEERSHVVEIGAGQQPLKISSEEIKVLGGFEVREGGTTTVALDFDAEALIRQQGNGSWLLVPVIVQSNIQNG